ncbi:MAG: formylglycine-generating enzyme family protein [Thiotrichaceae bacterium]
MTKKPDNPKATSSTQQWLDKLPQLSHLLSQGGLPVGTDVWIRISDLLIAKHQQQNLPQNPQELQWSLSGLIVTSEDQQQQFNTLYKQWLDDIGYGEAESPQQAHSQKQENKAQKEWQKRLQAQQKNKSIWKIIALAITLLGALAIAIYSFLPEPEDPEAKREKPEITTSTTKPAKAKSPIALQPTPLRKDLLPKATAKPNARQAYLLKLIERYLPLIPAFLFLLWLLAKWLRWKEVLRQQKGDPNDPLNHISISNRTEQPGNARLFNSPALSRALRAMHNTVKKPDRQLAIEATADATARAAGYFTPVYQQRAFVPPTVLMISYQHGRDQATGLALLLQQRLLHAGLEVHTYLFQGTPQRLLPLDEQHWTTLEEVTDYYPQANLVLISDPDIYLSHWSGSLHPWTEAISQWQQRALLYTRPPSQTTLNTFSQLSLQSAPLSSEGLRQISQQFSGVSQSQSSLSASTSQNTQYTQNTLPSVLARLTISDCSEEPDKAAQVEQIAGLKAFCNDEDDLYLLSTIAAYPELHWVLTQRLESELFNDQPPAQREQRLLRLLRLPWLRFGQIPHWLRLYLHLQQSREQQQSTHHLYAHLFKQAQISQQKGIHQSAKEQLQLPFNPNAHKAKPKRAYLRWLTTLRQASRNTSKNTAQHTLWEDQIFATTLLGKKPFDLDMLLPKALAKAIPHGRWRSLYPQMAGFVLLSVLFGSVFQQSWQRYGNQLAQDYWIQDQQLKQLLATTPVSIAISRPKSFATGAAMVRFEQQKQAAKLLKGALQKQGFKDTISIDIQATDKKSENQTESQTKSQTKKDQANQPSLISYAPQATLQPAVALIAKQLKHLSWGLEPDLKTQADQAQGIQIKLKQLTQAPTTFSDIAATPLSAEQKQILAKPINKKNPPAIQPFTLFRDSISGNKANSDKEQSKKQNKTNSLPTMIALPAGEFLMGSPENEPERRASSESPQHKVKLKAFAISQTEITFDQYDRFVEATKREKPNDEGWGRGDRPVINVSWNDATAYTKWLSGQTGQTYRLPSEAEWEYAARAGTNTPFSTGDCIHTDLANYDGNYSYNDCGAKTGEYREQTTPVTELPPNLWGLFGVHGNVWEWVEDCWHDNYEGAPKDGSVWQEASCDRRVVRGGGWLSIPQDIRSANRFRFYPDEASFSTGFRIARAL